MYLYPESNRNFDQIIQKHNRKVNFELFYVKPEQKLKTKNLNSIHYIFMTLFIINYFLNQYDLYNFYMIMNL